MPSIAAGFDTTEAAAMVAEVPDFEILIVLILYDADPPEPARARRRADMQAAACLASKRASEAMPSAAMLDRLS
jgi:hypothetical protein